MSKNDSSRNSKRGAQAPLLGSKVQVKIEKLAVGGAGVARHEGLVIFVQQAAPDEELIVEITLQKKNFAEAKIVQILKPSPSRRLAPCPVASRCGGCNWLRSPPWRRSRSRSETRQPGLSPNQVAPARNLVRF